MKRTSRETEKGGKPQINWLGWIASTWGLLGFTLLIASAIVRLSRYIVDLAHHSLSISQWLFMIGFAVFMFYAEGYKGFHLKLSPRFAARAHALRKQPKMIPFLLAPFFCVGYFSATNKRMIASYLLTLMIIGFVLIVSRFSQPWRGMVDFGVVLGLVVGLISIWYWWIRVNVGGDRNQDPEFPSESVWDER